MSKLTWPAFSAVLLAIFAISVGYGAILPVLPFQIEQAIGGSDTAQLARHTGLLTGVYILAIFIFAPLWGNASDKWGRRPIIVVGLLGFAAMTALLPISDGLPGLYVTRFSSGVFASAITPVAYALVGDHAQSKAWRAHRFTLINIAGTAGFFVGPFLGGFAVGLSKGIATGMEGEPLTFALLAPSALAIIAALAVWISFPEQPPRTEESAGADAPSERTVMRRLWTVAFVTALAVGSFEVGLALRAKQSLGLDAAHIGAMFAECSLVMFVVQALVFSPLMDPARTRWLIWPGLVTLATGLAVVPIADTSAAMTAAVALIAASAGILSPIATYWASLGSGEAQGANLGRMTAAASLGQALGSAGGGLLFNMEVLPDAGFIITALLVGLSLFAAFPLTRLLAPITTQTPVQQ